MALTVHTSGSAAGEAFLAGMAKLPAAATTKMLFWEAARVASMTASGFPVNRYSGLMIPPIDMLNTDLSSPA